MNNKLQLGLVVVLIVVIAISCSPVQRRSTISNTPSSRSSAQEQVTETISPAKESVYTLISGSCNAENCLFVTEAERDYPIGLATVTGYYAQIEPSAFEQTKRCDSFIIAEGPSALIQSILSLIERGNTVYTKNDLGEPVISLDLSTLMESEKQQLLSSSTDKPISVVLLATSPTDQGAPICYSRFQILRVE